MRYDTLHPLVLVNLSINACTEKKTEGVKDYAETFVHQSCNIGVFSLYAREIFLYGLYWYYFVGAIAKEFIYLHTCNVLYTYYTNTILFFLVLSLVRFSCSQWN